MHHNPLFKSKGYDALMSYATKYPSHLKSTYTKCSFKLKVQLPHVLHVLRGEDKKACNEFTLPIHSMEND